MSLSDYITESFRKRADSAAFFEAWVGAVLSRRNLFTVHHPFTLATETGNPVGFYAHTWDLDVSPDNKVFTPVEVKSVNLNFSSPTDYPHQGILVCSDASFQKKWPGSDRTGRDFLLVSRETGAIVWLPKGSDVTRKEVTDKKRGETYMCVASYKAKLQTVNGFVSYITDQGVF